MAIPKSEWIWHNGQLVRWEDATVHVMTHALHYGSSVFEGLRAYSTRQGTAILGLEAHVRRLFDSCRVMRMELPYTPDQVRAAILETVRRNGLKSCYIRPLVYRGAGTISMDARSVSPELVIIAFEFGPYLGESAIEQCVDVMVSSWRRMAPDTLATMAKTGGDYNQLQLVPNQGDESRFIKRITLAWYTFLT